MIKPDLILIWPQAVDYPLKREFVVENRDLFNKVIISFTHNSVDRDFRANLRQWHPDFTFVDSKENRSWYQDAMLAAINVVESQHVLFMEQDFVCGRDLLISTFEEIDQYYFICHSEGGRLHLAYFLTKTDHIKKTRLYFDQMPTHKLDCFDFFTAEMVILSGGGYMTLPNLGISDYIHLNGLTHNFRIAENKDYKSIYKPDFFKAYVQNSLDTSIKKTNEWRKFLKNIIQEI